MKKILLGTTAIAAAALYAQTAQAQITVSLGGYTEFFGAFYDDDAPNRTDREFELETEIVVRADGKADNGLLYGAKIELQNSTPNLNSTGVGTDEASVYLSGTWGRLELGDFDGAADTLAIYAPLVGIEQIDGDAYDFLTNTPALGTGTRAGFNLGGLPNGTIVKTPDSGDATKVMYITPRFAGFQAGGSYATQGSSQAQDVVAFKTAGGYKDFWEAGVNYTGEFAGFSLAAGATTSGATGQDTPFVGRSLEDFWTWQAGAQVGYAGFKFGGGYYDGGDFNQVAGAPNASSDSSAWHLGASYTVGPFAVGLTYAEAQGYKGSPTIGAVSLTNPTGVTSSTYASDYKTYGGGVAYTLAPGLVLQGDLMYVDEKLRNFSPNGVISTADNEGYVAVISTRLNF
jgi:outer membrane protein OmpU